MKYFFFKAGHEKITVTDVNLNKFSKKELKLKLEYIKNIKKEIPFEKNKDLQRIYKNYSDPAVIEKKIKRMNNEYIKLKNLLDYFISELKRNLI
jgi:hypothetical protein